MIHERWRRLISTPYERFGLQTVHTKVIEWDDFVLFQMKWLRLVNQAKTPVESRKCYVVEPTEETFARILSTHRTATRACASRCRK